MYQHFKIRLFSVILILNIIISAVGMPLMTAQAAPARAGDGVFTFASMGDAQAEAANFTATVTQIASLNPDLVIFNGDLENEGGDFRNGHYAGCLKNCEPV